MKKTFFAILFLIVLSQSYSQNFINDNVKAQYLLSFLRYLDWDKNKTKNGYSIGVLANDSIIYKALLSQSEEVKIKNKKIRITFIKSIETITNINILYVGIKQSNNAKNIYRNIKNKQILMVTDGLTGVNETMMNFLPNIYVRVELHNDNMESEGFYLPTFFKAFAKQYKKNYKEMFTIVNDSLNITKNIIEKQTEVLDKQLKEIEKKEKRITNLNGILKIRLKLVKDKEAELKKYSLLIEKKDSVLLQKTSILKTQKQEIKNQITQIEITKNKLNLQKQEIVKKELTLNNLNIEIKKQSNKINTQQGEIKRTHKEIKVQKSIIGFIVVILILLAIMAIFIYRNYKNKKKANKILEIRNIKITNQKNTIQEQNEELSQLIEEVTSQKDEIAAQRDMVQIQKNKIEVIHKEVSQSIDYAKRIQNSVLPIYAILQKATTDFFVLYKPKDKVSGDFYWWAKNESKTFITVADCTGHGVPGAFMSMLGTTFLQEIINDNSELSTGEILCSLRQKIISTLKQKGKTGEQKDGMDLALIIIDNKTNMIQFSGANNPLYIVTNSKLQILNDDNSNVVKLFDNSKSKTKESKLLYEIKPDKMPIAIYEKMDKFTTHNIQLKKGDQLYMFSDGYADQFGGPKGKKFKYKPFKQLIIDNADKEMATQKDILYSEFHNWKDKEEQVDDLIVMGIKL